MKKKKISKKLTLNKEVIASLNEDQQSQVLAGIIIRPQPPSEGCVYTITCYCTGVACNDSKYGANGCMWTNYGDMAGCPETMTLCGGLICP